MIISVVVPTYRRTSDLARCLDALKAQMRQADEVVVVIRDTDEQTGAFLKEYDVERLPLRPARVFVPGQVAALNVGLEATAGDVIAITDDDAAPLADWLERIEAHFLADERIGGVGGRDWVYHGEALEDGAESKVGRVQWYGRVVGNHHLGIGPARDVDILKGANMSYRRAAVQQRRFDRRLRGKGSEIHNDMAFSLGLRRAGWRLIYDPAVAVKHFRGKRFDEDQRDRFSGTAVTNIVHNETLAVLEHLPLLRRVIFVAWATLIGTRAAPGLLQVPRMWMRREPCAVRRLVATVPGRVSGLRTFLLSRSRAGREPLFLPDLGGGRG